MPPVSPGRPGSGATPVRRHTVTVPAGADRPSHPRAATPADVEAVIDEVAGLLRARGERMTGPRRAVLAVLAERGEHLSADAVLEGVARHDPGVHRASVYRTLDALSALGVVQHVPVRHGGTAYHLVRDGGRHLHARCRICSDVLDLSSDLLDDIGATIADRYGFVLDAGHVSLSGVCRACTVTTPAAGDAQPPPS